MTGTGSGFCEACGRIHQVIDHIDELCLPWTQVGKEVIDEDADLVASFVNEHDAYLAVQAVNSMYGQSARDE